MVRIPPNGGEKAQWQAKQVLDNRRLWDRLAAYQLGRGRPTMRWRPAGYPTHEKRRPLYEPAGLRGGRTGRRGAVLGGLTQQEYYDRADVWPLNPKGEIFVIPDDGGHARHRVPGRYPDQGPGAIGAILIGEGDLSQELGYPRQYEHPGGARMDGRAW